MSESHKIPLIVLTGFLGTGKTTLLNRWLRHAALVQSAVLINEFGEVGLDHQIVEPLDGAPVLLANGCVCCSIRDDLKAAILNLDARRLAGTVPPYRRILLETTGAADPAPILATLLNDVELRHHYRLALVATTVDAVNGLATLSRHAEARRQVAMADVLLLTKRDLVEPGAASAVEAALVGLNPHALLAHAEDGPGCLLSAAEEAGSSGAPTRSPLEDPDGHSDHGTFAAAGEHAHFQTFTLRPGRALDWTAFGTWLTLLLHTHGARILRIKGLLDVAGSDTPVVVNGVQHLVHPPYHLDEWPDGERGSRLVFITTGIGREEVEASLAAFNALGLALRPAADSSP